MLCLNPHPHHYRRAGLALAFVQLWLFIFGLPPFTGGVWLQVEPLLAAFFVCGALDFLWLGLGLYKRWLTTERPRPATAIMLAWVGWQILTCFAAATPWRAWFGPPQNGDGTAAWLAWLGCFGVMYSLWPWENSRRNLLIGAALALATVSLMHVFRSGDTNDFDLWKPNKWPDYLAFSAAYFWLAVMASSWARRPLVIAGLIALTLFAVLHSENSLGIIILTLGVAVTMVMLQVRPLRRLILPSHFWRRLAMLGCLLPLGWILFSYQYSAAPGSDSFLAAKDEGMGSRIMHIKSSLQAIASRPGRLFTGNGWGTSIDDGFKYALIEDVSVFQNGKRKPNWSMVDGETFHSHSQPLEALSALGIPGVLLWLLLPITLLRDLPRYRFLRCAPVIVATCALSYFWFQLPQILPFYALAWAAMLHRPLITAPVYYRNYALSVCMVAAIALIASFLAQCRAVHEGSRLYETLSTHSSTAGFDEAWLARDFVRGGDRLRAAVMGFTQEAIVRSRTAGLGAHDAEWLALFLQTTERMATSKYIGAQGIYLDLWLRYRILTDLGDANLGDLRRAAAAGLEPSVLRVATVAPQRDDVSTIFLLNLDAFTHGDAQKQFAILDSLLQAAPNNRPAMWLMGGLLAKNSDTRESGIALRKLARESGLSTVFPVDPP